VYNKVCTEPNWGKPMFICTLPRNNIFIIFGRNKHNNFIKLSVSFIKKDNQLPKVPLVGNPKASLPAACEAALPTAMNLTLKYYSKPNDYLEKNSEA
jgi:hypothetical protein